MWKSHFHEIFNCIRSESTYLSNYDCSGESVNDVFASPIDIEHAVNSLPSRKSCGLDCLYAEHIHYSSKIILNLLSRCVSSFLIHGFLPDTVMTVVLVPVIKDKAGGISCKNNYRPIALASITSKIIAKIILNRIEDLLDTHPNQFAYKSKHGTDQCIYVLKEIIDYYRTLNGTVFVSYLDASKAFDRINHDKLFDKLRRRGVPMYVTRLLINWYRCQRFCVRGGVPIQSCFLLQMEFDKVVFYCRICSMFTLMT